MTKTGIVHIVYGGGKGVLELTQEAAKGGTSEAGDQFGHALAVYDADLDGCSDLAIGSPYEDNGTVVDVGRVLVVYGSATGLGAGKATANYHQGAAPLTGATSEPQDLMGYSLAAGKSSTGVPFLAVGVPGEDRGAAIDAGSVIYFSGATTVTSAGIDQDDAKAGEVPDTAESYDRFGTSLAATPTHLAVGAPGESEGTLADAGSVTIFSHTLVSGVPKPLSVITQNTPNVGNASQAGDGFATSLAAVPHREAGATSTTESLLVVGIPGEDLGTITDAGAVQVFRLDAAGAYTQTGWIDQNSTNVLSVSEPGDHFGQRVAAVNTAVNDVSTPTETRMAIGVPGEDGSNGVADRGQVQIMPLIGSPGTSDVLIAPGAGMPLDEPRMYVGLSIAAGPAGFYVGAPYGSAAARAVYLYPHNVTSSGAPTQTFKPGEGSIPADAVTFGTAVR
ncbi:VCBS repeat-containing protein [Streptomyces sp. TBY4]|uniref:VCBS repeat-containing protein n=1 Tax=Streptomyces sp. TBY4 TaxID=2962030 RepID=UPI0020B7787F|nr:VCBS repeat-containing protein [Streptomyces sp. TBY4]MCP3755998.1 VCBS repeat-containing protein [Streptomyces sp. TBY4]